VRAVVDLAAGRGRPLADSSLYRQAAGGLPDGRVADGWASADGVRRLLAPAGGILGIVGALLDRPGLRGTSIALSPAADGARVRVRSVLAKGAPRATAFSPTLLDSVPARAVAAVDTTRIDVAAPRLLGLSSRGRSPLARAFRRLTGDVRSPAGPAVRAALLPLLRRESALSVLRGARGPVLTLVAPARDEGATRAALARARTAFRRLTVVYAVARGKVVISNDPQGIAAALSPGRSLADSEVLADRPDEVTSLVFLDFSQLLGLTQRAGLARDPTFARYQADLAKLGATGAASSTQGDIASVELSIKFK
jgi:hypothetical protein